MKAFLELVTALAVLAIVQHVALALGILLAIVFVMSATIYPRQAFALVMLIGLLALAVEQPLACAAGLGAITLVVAITKWVRRRSERQAPLLLEHRP